MSQSTLFAEGAHAIALLNHIPYCGHRAGAVVGLAKDIPQRAMEAGVLLAIEARVPYEVGLAHQELLR